MKYEFADRVQHVHRSFIREILKAGDDKEMISFAGGLPNPKFFPVEAVAVATEQVYRESGPHALQYTITDGYRPLREYIAARYLQKFDLRIDPDEILITTGSQQGLDLISKVFLNEGDGVVIESPGYLGAIQSFSFYRPVFRPVPLLPDGIEVEALAETLRRYPAKLFYTVPNFQNPSGFSYSTAKRQAVAELLQETGVLLIEDDPYGELRYDGEMPAPIRCLAAEHVLLLGSFSKVVSPGMRLGWVCAPAEVMDKLIVAKQAADLHTSHLTQHILYQYLLDNDLDAHIAQVRTAYRRQRDLMIEMIRTYFPPEVGYHIPDGGMFIWVTLPAGLSAMTLFEEAIRLHVAFVPGQAFYVDGSGQNTLRLNFSNTDEAKIEAGIQRLGQAIKVLLAGASA